jgi:hypothetical protein
MHYRKLIRAGTCAGIRHFVSPSRLAVLKGLERDDKINVSRRPQSRNVICAKIQDIAAGAEKSGYGSVIWQRIRVLRSHCYAINAQNPIHTHVDRHIDVLRNVDRV